jgi:hypothetical protein
MEISTRPSPICGRFEAPNSRWCRSSATGNFAGSHSAWLVLGRGFIESLERLTFAVSLGRDLGVCRFAQRLARSSPQSSALTKLRHGPLTCENAWLL